MTTILADGYVVGYGNGNGNGYGYGGGNGDGNGGGNGYGDGYGWGYGDGKGYGNYPLICDDPLVALAMITTTSPSPVLPSQCTTPPATHHP